MSIQLNGLVRTSLSARLVCFVFECYKIEFLLFLKSADHVYCIWKFNEGQKEPNILFRWHRSVKSDIIFDVRLGLSVTRKVF